MKDENFNNFTNAISRCFPNEDLRFNWVEGENSVRLMLPDHSPDTYEFQINEQNLQENVWDAIFAVKELICAFDS